MSDSDTTTEGHDQAHEQADPKNRVPGMGDDEQENRQHIAETGEPERDELGNADGAS